MLVMHAIYQDISISTDSAPDLSHIRNFLDRHLTPSDHEFLLALDESEDMLKLTWTGQIPARWSGAKFAKLDSDSERKTKLQCRLDGKFIRSAH